MYKIYEKRFFIIIFCLLLSIIGLTLASKNSPIYAFNDWVDANAFFTVGKSILSGLLPYRDFFEQKGPILYLIYMIGALISYRSFIGIYFLEIISFTISLYYLAKIINIFLNKKYLYLILPLFTAISLSSIYFLSGGSAEEFVLPFLAISFYHFLNLLINDKINNKIIFIEGFLAGIIFLIKYTLLGFWFVFIVTIFIKHILKKEYKNAIKNCLLFLSGMFVPIIITIFFLLLNNSLKDFINDYFIINITAYTSEGTIFDRIIKAVCNLCTHLNKNKIVLFLILFGLGFFTLDKKNIVKNCPILISFIIFTFGIYIGGRNYIYYFFDIIIYIILGLIALFKIVNHFKIKYLYLSIIVIIFSSCTLINNPNLSFSKYKKEDLPQYKFAEIINKKEGASLLNYKFLDGGFYTASGIIPNTKFFMRQNISCKRFPDNCNIQNSIIENKKVDFVVIRKRHHEKTQNKNLLNNYNLISTERLEKYTYELYERKN